MKSSVNAMQSKKYAVNIAIYKQEKEERKRQKEEEKAAKKK